MKTKVLLLGFVVATLTSFERLHGKRESARRELTGKFKEAMTF